VTISIDDATAIEGDVGSRFVDTFVPGASGGLNEVKSLAFHADGDLLVASLSLDSVLRYDGLTGAFVGQFVASNSGGLDGPVGLAFGPDGNGDGVDDLYVSSALTDQVLRYSGVDGVFIDAFVTAGDGGLDGPRHLVFGPDGRLYVGTLTDEVYQYSSEGDFLCVFVSAGSGGLGVPKGLLFGPDGNGDGLEDLYVSSASTDQVLRYSGVDGAFIDAFVTAGSGGLSGPNWMTFGPDGNLYVSSAATFEVLRYDGATGQFLDAFVPALSGGLYHPRGLAFDADGNLYVSNRNDGPDEVVRYAPVSSAVFTVTLSSTSAVPISVDFSTADGTAVEGTDYLPNSGTLTFLPGTTEGWIAVQTLGDAVSEQSESFYVTLSNPSPGASIGDGEGVGTIRDDVVVAAFTSTDVPKKLKDAVQDHGVTTSTLFVPDSGTVVDVDVHFDITHQQDWDLSVFLIAPDGTEVSLFDIWDNVGDITGEDFSGTILDDEASLPLAAGSAPFTGRYRPQTALSGVHSPDLNVENLSGTWTLRVEDCFHLNRGTLNSWSITVSYVPVEMPNSPPVAEAGGPYSGPQGSDITLDASGSTDADGTIVDYQWDLDDDGKFDDATGPTATFSSAVAGQYTAAVRVTDDDGDSSTDTATVTVTDPSAEQTYTSSDMPQDIADPHPRKGPRTTTSEISINSSDVIGSLVLDVDITHGAEAGLTVTLENSGAAVGVQTLLYEAASDGWLLENPAAFDDQPLGGTWTLSVTDTVKDGITGTLNVWSMTVTPQTGGAAPASAPLAADSFFSDLGDGSEEDRDHVLQPEIAELLLYDR